MARYKQKEKKPKTGSGGNEALPGLAPLDGPRPWPIVLTLAATVGLCFFLLQCCRHSEVFLDGRVFFMDPDSYTWLSRAEHVLSGQGLYVHFDPFDNYPEGFTSHWTQPFHWLLACLAVTFKLFGAGEAALEWAGAWICPLFGFLTAAMAAAWALRRWPWPLCALMIFTFMVNPFEQWTFTLGRPDHQCILIFLLLAAVLLLLDHGSGSARGRARLIGSAVCVAGGAWISVQALSLWALILGVLTLEGALAPREARAASTRDGALWSFTAAGAALVFALIERQGSFAVITDSLSPAHALFMALPAAGLFIVARLNELRGDLSRRSWLPTAIGIPLLLGLAGAVWLWTRQAAGQGPEIHDAMGRWFNMNLEFLSAVFVVNGELGLGRFHEAFGFSFYALPFLLFGLVRTRLLDVRSKWILGAGVVIAALLTLWQLRWRDLYALLFPPLFAVGVFECTAALIPSLRIGIKKGGAGAAGPAIAPCLAGALILLPWLQISWATATSSLPPRLEFRAQRMIAEWLKEYDPLSPGMKSAMESGFAPGRAGEPSVAVLTVWDQGPMIRYGSGRPVIAGPYHSNMEGILDTLKAYTARTPEAFDAIAEKRRIRYVVRPPLGDGIFDLYSFEWITGVEKPAIYVKTQQITPDRMRVLRGYDLSPGMTQEKVEEIFRFRLEKSRWTGWTRLKPVRVPGLKALLPDADTCPYLYRYEKNQGR